MEGSDMMKRDFRIARRELLRSALLGTAGIGAYGFLRELGLSGALKTLPGAQLLHAADVLADALSFGPSLFHVSRALAQNVSIPAVYRVFYTLVRAAGKTVGQEPAHALEDPPGKLI
jgi:hypothetical protein